MQCTISASSCYFIFESINLHSLLLRAKFSKHEHVLKVDFALSGVPCTPISDGYYDINTVATVVVLEHVHNLCAFYVFYSQSQIILV